MNERISSTAEVPLRFGVIGSTGIAATHLKQLQQLSEWNEATIVAVTDIVEENAKIAAEQYGCTWYKDYRQMLSRDDIDVINICAPSGLHADMAIACARAGKHVIVEKPMDISLPKAEEMIAVCRDAGVTLSVIMQNRFAPDVRKVKQAISTGIFGRPVLINAAVHWYRSQEYYDMSDWRGTWALDGGGAVMNQGIHTVDLLIHLMGDWETMGGFTATRGHERIEVEDTAAAAIQFGSGALGVLSSTTCAYPGFSVRIEWFGSEGSVVLEDNQMVYWKTKTNQPPPLDPPPLNHPLLERQAVQSERKEGNPNDLSVSDLDLHALQFLDVIAAIRNGQDSSVTGEEGIQSLRLIHELYRKGDVHSCQ